MKLNHRCIGWLRVVVFVGKRSSRMAREVAASLRSSFLGLLFMSCSVVVRGDMLALIIHEGGAFADKRGQTQ